MARTRKRDDDSQYNNSINSDTTSLAALDASSMSATGSRSSLTFASSNNNRKKRPRKRRRKSLTDALQSISLDKDKGVPEQILKMGDFPFSKACVAFTLASGNGTPILSGTFGGHDNGTILSDNRALNSQQQLHRQLDRGNTDGDGDLYYDDDNSQLTSSSVEGEGGMEDDYEDEDEDNDDEEDSQRKRLAQMTDLQRAQRNVMFELVFGKDYHESRKKASGSDRELSACEARTPPVRIDPGRFSPPPPFASISTRTRSKKATTAPAGHQRTATVANFTATAALTSAAANKMNGTKDRGGSGVSGGYQDPADRKIEKLLRRSLKNIREGSHPLQLKSTPDDEDDGDLLSKWNSYTKTQDDMMIDPEIYSPRTGTTAGAANVNANANPANKTSSMSIEGTNNLRSNTTSTDSRGRTDQTLQTRAFHFGNRPRSNSLPSELDKAMDITAMDTDG